MYSENISIFPITNTHCTSKLLQRLINKVTQCMFTDPCLSRTVGEDYSYPSNFNCRSFYQCSKSGRSVPMCCRDNYRYDYDTQQCRPDKSCNISCSQREGQEYYNDYNDQMQKTDPYGKYVI